MSELGSLFREIRGHKGVTQEKLAEKASVARTTITSLENGKQIKLDTLRLLCERLGASRTEKENLILAWLKLELDEDYDRVMSKLHPTTWPVGGNRRENLLRKLSGKSNDTLNLLVWAADNPKILRILQQIRKLSNDKE